MTEIYYEGKKVINLSIERHDVDHVELAFTFEDGTQERAKWEIQLIG